MTILTRDSAVGDWNSAILAAGVTVEPDCALVVWAEQNATNPLKALSGQAYDIVVSACMACLRVPQNADKSYFVELLNSYDAPSSVKRWASTQ